jgi:hypothetical protein
VQIGSVQIESVQIGLDGVAPQAMRLLAEASTTLAREQAAVIGAQNPARADPEGNEYSRPNRVSVSQGVAWRYPIPRHRLGGLKRDARRAACRRSPFGVGKMPKLCGKIRPRRKTRSFRPDPGETQRTTKTLPAPAGAPRNGTASQSRFLAIRMRWWVRQSLQTHPRT